MVDVDVSQRKEVNILHVLRINRCTYIGKNEESLIHRRWTSLYTPFSHRSTPWMLPAPFSLPLPDSSLADNQPLNFLNPWIYSVGYKGLDDIVHGGSTGCCREDFGRAEMCFGL